MIREELELGIGLLPCYFQLDCKIAGYECASINSKLCFKLGGLHGSLKNGEHIQRLVDMPSHRGEISTECLGSPRKQ
jgi:hypothetical protein